MKIPPFEDFLKDMGEDYLKNLITDALGNGDTAEFNFANVIATNFRMNEWMLSDYHAWLSRQLQKDSEEILK